MQVTEKLAPFVMLVTQTAIDDEPVGFSGLMEWFLCEMKNGPITGRVPDLKKGSKFRVLVPAFKIFCTWSPKSPCVSASSRQMEREHEAL